MTFNDLMAGPPPTHLPEDPAVDELASGVSASDVVRSHPESPAAWATLAEAALADESVDDVTAYAYMPDSPPLSSTKQQVVIIDEQVTEITLTLDLKSAPTRDRP